MIEEAKKQAALAEEARRRGLAEWHYEAAAAVPTAVIRDVVADNRQSSAVAPSPSPRSGGSGWQDGPRPLPLPSDREVELIDRLAQKFAGPPTGPIR
jgi:hypothetical protein